METENRSFVKYTADRAVKNCPFCDTENSAEMSTCFLCGTSLFARFEKESDKKKRWWEKVFE